MLYTLTAALALFLFPNPQQPAQKPVVDSPIIGDYLKVPDTLDGFITASDLVVFARAAGARDVSRGRPRTEYDVTVTEVIKGNVSRGQHATVCRAIGTIERPDRFARIFQPGFPSFEIGSEYLLFLRWDSTGGCYWPTFGRVTAAPFDAEGRLAPHPRSGIIEHLKGLSRSEVTQRLNRRGK
jgi:hypothetical protein